MTLRTKSLLFLTVLGLATPAQAGVAVKKDQDNGTRILPVCGSTGRCVIGAVPISNSTAFNDSSIQITIANFTEKEQNVHVSIYANDGAALKPEDDNIFSLKSTYQCEKRKKGWFQDYDFCKEKDEYVVLHPGETIHHTLKVVVKDAAKPNTSVLYKIEVEGSAGAVSAHMYILRNEPWAGVTMTGVPAVGSVRMMTWVPINSGNPL